MGPRPRGLSQVLRGGELGAVLAHEARIRITPAVDELVTRARNAGQLPADVGPGDLVLAELMVGAVAERAGPDDEATWRRALSIVLAGLRADGLVGTTPDGSNHRPPARTLNDATGDMHRNRSPLDHR